MPYVTTGGGGMGNQIKKLISALRLDPSSKGHLSYFEKIFKDQSIWIKNPKLNYVPINTWRINVLPTDIEIPGGFCQITTSDKGFNNCDINGRNVDSEYLRIPVEFRNKIIKLINEHLQFSSYVNDKVNNFINNHGEYSSVHLRTFKADNFPNDKSSVHAAARHKDWVNRGRQLCINYIKEINDETIFLASDSDSESNLIKSSCPNKKFIQYNANDERTHVDDFIDMVILSKGNHMVLNTISTYSEVAWYFSGCNQNIYLC